MFLSGNLDDDRNCEAGLISFPNGKTRGGGQELYKITSREEFAKMNEPSNFYQGFRPGSQIKAW
jgi:hypothetical protein